MRAHRVSVALVALGTILVAAGVLAFTLGTAHGGPDAAAAPRQFVVECTWSHRGADDPIVHPGHPGASHLHDFFGSTQTDASSTPAALVGGPTTCQTSADTAAYWTPTLFDGDEPVDPGRLFAYYRVPPGVAPADLVPHPFGLALVAGDAHAPGPQSEAVAAWHCGGSADGSEVPPSCSRDAPLTLRLVFPSCWNGADLDSADHTTHVAYPTAAGCPPEHPRAMPELVVDVVYAFWGPPDALRLDSGPTSTAHGDFLNAWAPDALADRVDACLRSGDRCGIQPNRASISR